MVVVKFYFSNNHKLKHKLFLLPLFFILSASLTHTLYNLLFAMAQNLHNHSFQLNRNAALTNRLLVLPSKVFKRCINA